MSAAAFRYAARRNVGGRVLQRTRAAAVEGVEGRRLIHSGKPLSSPRVSPASRSGSTNQKSLTSDEGRIAGQIQKMKEELYSALAETERKNTIVDSLVSQNGRLMEYLSVQVSPKPKDPLWRSYRRGQMVSECLRIGAIVFLASMVGDRVFGTEADPKGKLVDYVEN